MSIRESEEYQNMSLHHMLQLTYGEAETEEEQLAFWQKMVDTGYAWRLEGFFGRQAMRLIEDGVIEA
jgi:hypothetical protein